MCEELDDLKIRFNGMIGNADYLLYKYDGVDDYDFDLTEIIEKLNCRIELCAHNLKNLMAFSKTV